MDSGGGGCKGWVEVFGGMDGRKSIGGEGVQIVYLWVTRQDHAAETNRLYLRVETAGVL